MKDALQPFIAILRAKGFFRKDGQTLVEYALVLAVLSVVLILCTAMVTGRIKILFSIVNGILDNVVEDDYVGN